MNRIYKLVWKFSINAPQVASEYASSGGKGRGGLRDQRSGSTARRGATRQARKPLLAALLMALSAPAAFALTPPPSGALPGNGVVVDGTATAAITGSTAATVTVGSGNTVITWNATSSSGDLLSSATNLGFNIGSSAAVDFQNTAAGSAAVLNIDTTGNASQIYGGLSATVSGSATATDAPTLFVANANGVVVGSGATISAPYGVGFIGADLNSTEAQAVFASCGAVPLYFDNTAGSVSVQNGVSWGATTSFLLVAGAGSVNVGSAPNGGVLFIDGGVGGHFSPIGAGIATSDQGSASSIASLSTSNYSSGFVYQDAATSVSVNLGTAAPALEDVSAYADGTLDNSGVLNASGGNIALNATGTITNTSGISAANMVINTTSLYGNTGTAENGAFVNTGTAAVIDVSNSGGSAELTAKGTSFSNLSGASIGITAGGSGYTARLYFDGSSVFTNSGSGSTINVNASSGHAELSANGTSFSNLSGASIGITAGGSGDSAVLYFEGTGAFTNSGSGSAININASSGYAYLSAYGTSFNNLSGASITLTDAGSLYPNSNDTGLFLEGTGSFLNATGATISVASAGIFANGSSFTNDGNLSFTGAGDTLNVDVISGSVLLNGLVSGSGLANAALYAASAGQNVAINTALSASQDISAWASNLTVNASVSAGTNFTYYAQGSTSGSSSATPLINNVTVTTLGSISAPTIDIAYSPNATSGNPSTGYGNLQGASFSSVTGVLTNTYGYQSLTNLDINGPLFAGSTGTVNFGQAVQVYNGNTYSSAIDVVTGSSYLTAGTVAFNNLLVPPHPENQITFTPSGHYFPITTQPTNSVTQATNLPGNGEVIYSDPLSVVFNTSTIYQNPSQVPGLGTSSTGATINISGQTNVTAGTPVPLVIGWGVPTSYATLNASTASGFDIGTGAVLSFVNSATYAGGSPAAVDVLNIDVSGYPSNLYGTLDYEGNGGSLWVANGNGILVGSSATLTAPGGLGLIAPGGIQNITAPNVFNLISSFVTGSAWLDFNDTNATGGVVSIARGANLAGVQQFLDVAGYNSVNVNAPSLSNTVALSVDGGIGAHVNTTTGAMTPYDDSSVTGYLTDAPTSVSLDVGTGTSAGTAYSNANALILADGNLVNNGNLSVNETQVDWINGTFSNDGALQMTPFGTQGYAVLGFETFTTSQVPSGLTSGTQTVYGNTSAASGAPTGDFVNAGVLNATTATEGFGFFGAGFQNDAGATLNVSGSAYIGSSNDGVTLAGTQEPLSGSLAVVALGGNSVINVQSPISAATSVLLAANTVNISSVIDPLGSFTFFGPESGAAQMNLAAGGSIDAANVYLGTEGSASITNFVLNGTINGTSSVLFGSGTTPTGHVKGAGSITTPSLTFANLQGSVHNIVSPVIALNGFQVNAENPASTSPVLNTVNLSVSADGTTEQGINLKVNGNLAIDSGNTQAIDAGGAIPANANSILYVQATGNVQVNAGTGTNNYGGIAVPNTTDELFQFPGLVYLQAGSGTTNSLTVGSTANPVVIANAFAPSAQVGREGVFLIAPTINYYANSLYTNGNAGVVFAAPYNGLGFPDAVINGNSGNTYVTDGMPTVYFMRSVPTAAYGEELLPSDVFTNDNGQLQEMQTFLNLY
ncbi:filamentous hemagglutinin N-terminal domain-containing protein [Acidithiobacillus sulfuriphilus]|uniref:filamentous hemagglutinin N-terminal domain-containing protein n=1 Tax=Acidithiobacillus sulfuriphilus TaxID=1867749 RepID=UPI003F6459BF